MNLTNLLDENNLNIYEHFKNEFNKSGINFLRDVIYTKKDRKVKIEQNKFLFNEKSNKLFKKLLMTYAYNKEVFGMSKDIEESELYDLTPTEIYYHMSNLFKFFKKEFIKIQILKSLIKDVIKYTYNDFLILNQDSNFISTQFYSKQISKKITRTYQKERFSMTIKTDIKPRQINKSKTERATMPNLIHSIDAQILYSVIKKLRNEEIPVYTIHDCFVIPKEHVLKVKKIYLDELQNIYNSNVLQKFINNNVCNEEYRIEIYEKYKDIIKEEEIKLNNINGLKEEKIEVININSSKKKK